MPYKRSGRAGGKSVSMIGMLVFLLAALLVLPSCFDDDTETVEVPTGLTCGDGTVQNAAGDMCVADEDDQYDLVGELEESECYSDGARDGRVLGTDAVECILGEGGNDSIKGMGGDDNIDGGPGNDTLYGGDGDDTLDGDTGNDMIDGGAGDDELIGGDGNDMIDGGAGDDELIGGFGNNALDGGDGEDIAIYLEARQATVDLRSGKARVQHGTPATGSGYISLEDSADSGTGNDTLTNIENVKGTHTNDRIDGDDNANLLKGLDGADVINGRGGDDTIIPNRPMVVENETPRDGADVVDGGAGSDTISYEGEAAGDGGVTIDLNTIVAAHFAYITAIVGDANDNDVVDQIKVVNEGTEDDPKWVSTIENLKGGAGEDALTGDTRANRIYGLAGSDTLHGGAGDDTLMGGAGDDTLHGGAGDDTLMGGAGDDTLHGGAGDDTYVVVVGDGGTTAVEDADGGMDTLKYVAQADDEMTEGMDESEIGVGAMGSLVSTFKNVEVTLGTPNADYLMAHIGGATILGREGDDNLNGGAGDDRLVGCAGENTLNGGAGDDVFGVLNGSTTNEIGDFTTGEGMATTDEIHLKGFAGEAVTFAKIADNVTHAAVQVGGVTVATVTSETIKAIADVAESRTKVEAIIDALGKSDAVQMVEFEVAKCSSN